MLCDIKSGHLRIYTLWKLQLFSDQPFTFVHCYHNNDIISFMPNRAVFQPGVGVLIMSHSRTIGPT